MGYGLINIENNNVTLIDMGVIKLNKLSNQALKLKKIFETVLLLIDKYNPDELAIEAPFYGKNVQSMLKLGRAQGVAMSAALYRDVPIHEYSPKKIKQSITGNGNASKEQVASMLSSLILIKDPPEYLDATDGLAAALCHYLQKNPQVEGKKYSGWNAFVVKNPNRIISE